MYFMPNIMKKINLYRTLSLTVNFDLLSTLVYKPHPLIFFLNLDFIYI